MSTIVADLKLLVDQRQYADALARAEQMLLDVTAQDSPVDLMWVHRYLGEARLETGEPYGAQVALETAQRMAREVGDRQLYGEVLLNLAVVYDRLGRSDLAITTWYEYLSHRPYLRPEDDRGALVCFNLGVVILRQGDHAESIDLLHRGLAMATATGQERTAHGIRHALIAAYLESAQFGSVPALLARCAHYLRHHMHAQNAANSLHWHRKLRADFAIRTGRPARARRVIARALAAAADCPYMQFHFRMLLGRIHELNGAPHLALHEVICARAAAVEARRYDAEQQATDWLFRLLAADAGLLERATPDPNAYTEDLHQEAYQRGH